MNTMDQRIAERRHQVTEDRARGRLRWLVAVVLSVGVVALAVWLVNSPLLSIRSVTVAGSERSDPMAIADRLGVREGVSTMSVRAGAVEAALLSSPWIADAEVVVSWPGRIEIDVVERTPVAALAIGSTTFAVAADGVLVERSNGGAIPPLITIDGTLPLRVGDQVTGASTLGAIEFAGALPPALRRSARISVTADTVEIEIDGIAIVVGRPIEMTEKAAAVEAVMALGVARGSRIDVSAPLRPAVAPPQSQLNGETETLEESQPSD